MKRKLFIAVIVTVIILFATNPSNEDFKKYINGIDFVSDKQMQSGRINYYGVFSIYQSNTLRYYGATNETERYVGVFKNFIKLEKENSDPILDTTYNK